MSMDKQDLSILRHSTSHVMAMAVKELFPETKLAIGPSIDDGFYYDFEIGRALTPEDLKAIEKKMNHIIRQNVKFERTEMPKAQAAELMSSKNEKYKIELIDGIADENVSFYKNGEFIDLCRGPHLDSTGQIKAFKLLKIAGAYWRGDENNAMLQRIYGTCFENQADLDEYLKRLEEAAKRDHRKIGKELDLFNIYHDEAGAGLVFYHPKGTVLREIIEVFLKKEHRKRGYLQVMTPHIAKIDLWKTSGHADFYKENMYFLEIGRAHV